jgi:hypothetical protein
MTHVLSYSACVCAGKQRAGKLRQGGHLLLSQLLHRPLRPRQQLVCVCVCLCVFVPLLVHTRVTCVEQSVHTAALSTRSGQIWHPAMLYFA